MKLQMGFLKKLNDTYDLLNKLDDSVNKNNDNGSLKTIVMCVGRFIKL